eukprot:2730469-Lingulodinium_polyedra.AAC.1
MSGQTEEIADVVAETHATETGATRANLSLMRRCRACVVHASAASLNAGRRPLCVGFLSVRVGAEALKRPHQTRHLYRW